MHQVNLSWTPSTSGGVGYFVYRSNAWPIFERLNSVPIQGTSFTDTVQGYWLYSYVVTAVDSNAVESVQSNQANIFVPF